MEQHHSTAFGQLRSLMNQNTLGFGCRIALSQAIKACAKENPQEYASQWLPYMASFPQHFGEPLVTLATLEELGKMAPLMPFASIHLELPFGKRAKRDSIRAIARSPHLASVSKLSLPWIRDLSPGEIKALAKSPYIHNVVSLCIRTSLEQRGMKALMQSTHLTGLRDLNVMFNGVKDEGIKLLVQSNILPKLTSLKLNCCMSPAGIGALVNSQSSSSLTSLALPSNKLENEALQVIAHASQLTGLRHIDLSDNDMGSLGVRALAHAGNLASLKTLNLDGSRIGVTGAKLIAQSESLSCLEALHLKFNDITDQGAIAIANSNMTNLKVLDLEKNAIKTQGAIAIASSPTLANLEQLCLRANKVRLKGREALAASPYLKESVKQMVKS